MYERSCRPLLRYSEIAGLDDIHGFDVLLFDLLQGKYRGAATKGVERGLGSPGILAMPQQQRPLFEIDSPKVELPVLIGRGIDTCTLYLYGRMGRVAAIGRHHSARDVRSVHLTKFGRLPGGSPEFTPGLR